MTMIKMYIFAIGSHAKCYLYKILLISSYVYITDYFLRENILHQQQMITACANLTPLCTASIVFLLEIKNNNSQQREFKSLNYSFCGI